MASPIVLHIDGFALQANEDGEPRIRDVDLAARLGYDEPRAIRKLIARMIDSAELVDVAMRSTVSRIEKRGAVRGIEAREVTEYWLDEEQALLVCMRSDAPRAVEVRRLIVKVFRAALRQVDAELRRAQPVFRRLIEALLLPKAADDWERMFQPSLVKAICALHGESYEGGTHPRFLASTNRKIYDMVFSTPVGREIKTRNPLPKHGSNHHQHLAPEAREYFAMQLKVVEAIARQSISKDDFWHRMEREYGNGLLQLPLYGDSSSS